MNASASSPADGPVETAPAVEGYRTVRQLGAGGFGEVFLAVDEATRRPCALKISTPQPAVIRSLQREIEVLKRVRSPGVPELYATGTQDGRAWMAMERIDGKPWPLTVVGEDRESLLRRLGALVRALEQLHVQGIAHCDLKPDNILCRPDGSVTLIDFGLSCWPGAEAPAADVAGTPQYMSTEQCTPGAGVDTRSDVYALGVIVYAALTGAAPYEGSAEEVREAHRSNRPPSLVHEGHASEVDDVLRRMLAKDAASRPASVSEALELLARALPEGPVLRSKPKPPPARKRAAQSKKIALLWFTSAGSVVGLRKAVADSGGSLIQARGGAFVAAYAAQGYASPTRAALTAAHAMVGRGLAERIVIDLADATIRKKADGSERIVTRALKGPSRQPTDAMPAGLLATAVAARQIPDTQGSPVHGYPDLVHLQTSSEPLDITQIQESVPLFGREPLLARMRQHAARTAGTTPGMFTVLGSEGVGKSRLAQDVAERLRAECPGTRVLAIRVPRGVAGSSTAVLRRLLLQLIGTGERSPADPDQQFSAAMGEPVDHETSLGLRLAVQWLDPAASELDHVRAAPGAMRALVARSAGALIRAAARQRPLHLVIDDAHLLDDPTLDALEYAGRPGPDISLWIAVFARAELTSGRIAWGSRAGTHERTELGALEPRHAARLVRHLLQPATNLPDAVIDKLVERARGIPMLLTESVRALKRDGLVKRAERGRGWVLDIDVLDERSDVPLVEWLLEREVDNLAESLRNHASMTAVLGPRFEIEDVIGLVRGLELHGDVPPSELDPRVGVERLRRAEILQVHEDGRFGFRNELLQERLVQRLSPDIRLASHASAYRHIGGRTDLPIDERSSRLAYHAQRAQWREIAAGHHLRLATRARARHDDLRAHQHFAAALPLLEPGDQRRLPAVHGLALARFRLGRHEAALEGLERAASLAAGFEDTGTLIDVLLDAATVLDWTEDYPTSAEKVTRAAELAGARPSPLAYARLRMGQGRSAFRTGDVPKASALLQEAAELAAGVGESGYETRVIALLLAAPLASFAGENERSEALFAELFDACRSHGDELHLATSYLNRCVVWLSSGAVDPLIEDLRQAIAVASRAGFPLLETRALYNLGEVCYWVGRHDDAVRYAESAIDLALQLSGAAQRVVVSRLLLARCHVERGQLRQAQRELDAISEAQREGRAESRKDIEFMPNDALLLRAVTLVIEGADQDAWLSLSADSQGAEQERIEVFELAGIAALRRGDMTAAQRWLDDALAAADQTPTLLRPRLERRRAALELSDAG